MPYYIACPYCEQDKSKSAIGQLKLTKDLKTYCGHKEGFFDKNKECRKEDFVCKEIYECPVCDGAFRATEEFIKSQKRKDKDG